jgi:hypothetical protein
MSIALDTLNETERKEFERIRNSLGQMRWGHKIRTSKKVARAILRDGWWTWNGRFCDPIVEPVGLGIVDVSVKELT